MAGDSVEQPGVFILYLALNAPMTKGRVHFGGRNQAAPVGCRGEAGGIHFKWLEEFATDPCRKRFMNTNFHESCFERLTKEDEARIGVLCAGARLGLKRELKAFLQEFRGRGGGTKKLNIARQA